MIKFRAIIIDKRKQDHANEILKIGSKEIKFTSQVKLLGGKINVVLKIDELIQTKIPKQFFLYISFYILVLFSLKSYVQCWLCH